jgi:hypothetical protein
MIEVRCARFSYREAFQWSSFFVQVQVGGTKPPSLTVLSKSIHYAHFFKQ